MDTRLQLIRDLRRRLETDKSLSLAGILGLVPGSIESELMTECRRREMIDALKHCEYLLEIGDSVHAERAR